MKAGNDFALNIVDLDESPSVLLYYPTRDIRIVEDNGDIKLDIKFRALVSKGVFESHGKADITREFLLRSYGDSILRFSGAFSDRPVQDESPMLELDPGLERGGLSLTENDDSWLVHDEQNRLRMRVRKAPPPVSVWSEEQPPAWPMLEIDFLPDGSRTVPLSSHDQFFPGKLDSVGLACIEKDGRITASLFALKSDPSDCYFGTGERFTKMDLSGRTIVLDNTDGLGNNGRKTYKNVPFFVSTAGYGVFLHSSYCTRMSFNDISNRAVQLRVDEDRLDVFLIGGGSPEPILHQYRRLTGFSPEMPLWSYGVWMSRMTYFSAEEVEQIVDRLSEEDYPLDVIHLDTGYFRTNWVCEWRFSEERFPEPEKFIRKLGKKGIRITLWQTPNIGKDNPLYAEAVLKGVLPIEAKRDENEAVSDFSGQDFGGQIDFTNPDAVSWYQDKLRNLLNMGVAAIKTDFGEKLNANSTYKNMSPDELHNIYGLLYQKAAFEVSSEFPDKPIIWARAGWAGCQRYPIHWGGDTSSTWDGMKSVLRGGLHLGLSGFTYWSHDVPGFHGLPEFMNTMPEDDLYLRWTQFGVLTSHFRYHGTSAREPWFYPSVADAVRIWWKLRYCLIPYLMEEGKHCSRSGLPMIAALVFHHPQDPVTWHIDDQYYLGRDLLVAPIMNGDNRRDVYLPAGRWVDFFSGEIYEGGNRLKGFSSSKATAPLFVRYGAEIPIYLDRVSNTDEMEDVKTSSVCFDESYSPIHENPIGKAIGFSQEHLVD